MARRIISNRQKHGISLPDETREELLTLLKELTPNQRLVAKRLMLGLLRQADGKKPHRFNHPQLRLVNGGRR